MNNFKFAPYVYSHDSFLAAKNSAFLKFIKIKYVNLDAPLYSADQTRPPLYRPVLFQNPRTGAHYSIDEGTQEHYKKLQPCLKAIRGEKEVAISIDSDIHVENSFRHILLHNSKNPGDVPHIVFKQDGIAHIGHKDYVDRKSLKLSTLKNDLVWQEPVDEATQAMETSWLEEIALDWQNLTSMHENDVAFLQQIVNHESNITNAIGHNVGLDIIGTIAIFEEIEKNCYNNEALAFLSGADALFPLLGYHGALRLFGLFYTCPGSFSYFINHISITLDYYYMGGDEPVAPPVPAGPILGNFSQNNQS